MILGNMEMRTVACLSKLIRNHDVAIDIPFKRLPVGTRT